MSRAHTGLALAALLLGGCGLGGRGEDLGGGRCGPRFATAAYAGSIQRAIDSGPDLWGSRLLASRNGPTLAAAQRFLTPLLLATQRSQRPLTPSGFYYVPLSFGFSSYGPAVFALHVADGSEIITRHVGGPSLTLYVGDGRERYGSCTQRLHPAKPRRGLSCRSCRPHTSTRGASGTHRSRSSAAPTARAPSSASSSSTSTHARRAPARRSGSSRGSCSRTRRRTGSHTRATRA